MLLNAGVSHSKVMYNEMEFKAVNSRLKVCWEPSDEALLDTVIPKQLELSNQGSNYLHSGQMTADCSYDITYPYIENVTSIKPVVSKLYVKGD